MLDNWICLKKKLSLYNSLLFMGYPFIQPCIKGKKVLVYFKLVMRISYWTVAYRTDSSFFLRGFQSEETWPFPSSARSRLGREANVDSSENHHTAVFPIHRPTCGAALQNQHRASQIDTASFFLQFLNRSVHSSPNSTLSPRYSRSHTHTHRNTHTQRRAHIHASGARVHL